jgi:hypothetical protein
MGGIVDRTRRLMGGSQRFWFFFQFIQNCLNLKIKMGALTFSKNSQSLHVASLGYDKQFSQLYQHQIPNTKRFKN